jgi:oxygen-dependent protoporphyrinogen oxidase
MSIGRAGETEHLQRNDDDLTAMALRDLETVLGEKLPMPQRTRVDRWGGGLPQYAPGHLQRVEEARAALGANVALAGAAYDGIGIPACIASGERAAQRLLEGWDS